MRKTGIAFSLIVALLLAVTGTAVAITNGQPDDGQHPYIGLIVFDGGDPDASVQWRAVVAHSRLNGGTLHRRHQCGPGMV